MDAKCGPSSLNFYSSLPLSSPLNVLLCLTDGWGQYASTSLCIWTIACRPGCVLWKTLGYSNLNIIQCLLNCNSKGSITHYPVFGILVGFWKRCHFFVFSIVWLTMLIIQPFLRVTDLARDETDWKPGPRKRIAWPTTPVAMYSFKTQCLQNLHILLTNPVKRMQKCVPAEIQYCLQMNVIQN